ncbi:hypothetical protein JJQ72_07190 [Paenibacillus sp. F411]|uniref:Uncharacterized protein n=1 Tax=Paenibacillus algicola TaxID=2565926 RepID=A0A4P8XML4_9BACL|nr:MULTISPECIES: hypothetical protein [Paenibacillus]MBO2943756.1 hypothetical protein [Paenibacillus sp. F411]QCT04032.1 hypothetical protein E6C60_3321 [Paenibacillus algicola]
MKTAKMNWRQLLAYIVGGLFFLLFCQMFYRWLQRDTLGVVDDFIRLAIPLGVVMSALTWGTQHQGFSQDDELGKTIQLKSAKISYYALLIALVILLVVEKYVNGQDNVPLNLILCFGLAVYPVAEFLISRRYK